MLREAQFVDLPAIVHLYQQLTQEMAALGPDTYRPFLDRGSILLITCRMIWLAYSSRKAKAHLPALHWSF